MRHFNLVRSVGFPLVLSGVLLTAACSEGPHPQKTAPAKPPVQESPAPPAVAEPTACPGGGRLIKALTIPPFHADAVQVPGATIGGVVIPAVTIAAVDLPAQHVPAQCVEVQPAPGGCLSAVTIPATELPPVTLPGYDIPAINMGGITTKAVHVEPQTSPGSRAEGSTVAEVCQEAPSKSSGYVPGIYRKSLYRNNLYRRSLYRKSTYLPRVCNAQKECMPSFTVPSVSLPSVSLPSVGFRSASLHSEKVDGARVLKGDGTVAFEIKADVLFDFGSATLKSGAVPALVKIAEQIRRLPESAEVRVDGHTDGKGDDQVNQTLSEQRAKAVLEWLATAGRVARDRLKATGYGETKPTAPNVTPNGSDNPRGREQNRRVVISTAKS
jgi:outer membrane protein OmpA-like peptidoglycan-associated protein